MKFLVLLSALSLSFAAQAAPLKLSCDVVNMLNSSIFEDGLGQTGSPEVDDNSENVSLNIALLNSDVSIGQFRFRLQKDKTSIVLRETPTTNVVDVVVKGSQVIQVRVSKKTLTGVVLQKDEKAKSFKAVAEIDCNDYSAVKKAIDNGKTQSRELMANQVPKLIARSMGEVDVAYEMGDGYYDLQNEKFYELSIKGKIVGYALESYLNYTEGDPKVAYTYFLANGLRFSGPNGN